MSQLGAVFGGSASLEHHLVVLGTWASAKENDAEFIIAIGYLQTENRAVERGHYLQVVHPEPGVTQLDDPHG
jgi:hypothetical protein